MKLTKFSRCDGQKTQCQTFLSLDFLFPSGTVYEEKCSNIARLIRTRHKSNETGSNDLQPREWVKLPAATNTPAETLASPESHCRPTASEQEVAVLPSWQKRPRSLIREESCSSKMACGAVVSDTRFAHATLGDIAWQAKNNRIS